MFIGLLLVLSVELLTFGGVLKEWWLGIFVVSIAAIAGLLVFQIIRGKLQTPMLIAVAAVLLTSPITGPQFTAALLAGVWTWQACRSAPHRIARFLHVLIVIGILEALLGLFQYSVQPGWIFGYHNMFSRVSGTFINHNHYAGLLELLIFIPLGRAYLYWSERESALAYLYVLATAVMGLALVFSLSRMGMGSFSLSLLIIAGLIRFHNAEQSVPKSLAFALVGLIAAGVIWVGVDVVVDRYGELIASDQAPAKERRPKLYSDTLRLIKSHPFGTGVGKYQDIFRRYQTYDGETLFDHAHNDYLETAAEWGIIPAALFWAFIFAIVVRTIRCFLAARSATESAILIACLGGIMALLIHSLADFNLQIPVNAALFFSLLGMAAAFPLDSRLSHGAETDYGTDGYED
jgi:O-antigen ligase